MAVAAFPATKLFSPIPSQHHHTITRYNLKRRKPTCRAQQQASSTTNKTKSFYYGCDLYELLGVDNTASQPEIKKAYRWLQKRCHPDVAGELGHDMSILLNDAYAILSDPFIRSSYDSVRAEWIQHEGFTGQPVYSKWLGPACEERAVFVDEVRCIGCLKCALIASNTFAVEKQFGRARAVSQWGDAKPVIEDAIRACPVDCISWVDRSQLAALEYLMSKQPRFAVNIDAEVSGGERAIDVFKTAEKFLKKNAQFQSHKEESSAQSYRAAAVDAIQARAGRWWHFFVGKSYSTTSGDDIRSSQGAIIPSSGTEKPFGRSVFVESKLRALYEAVTSQKGVSSRQPGISADEYDYWEPLKHVDPSNSLGSSSPSFTTPPLRQEHSFQQKRRRNSPVRDFLLRTVPTSASVLGGVYVALVRTDPSSPTYQSLVGGPVSNLIRHSPLLQELLYSGVTQPLLAAVAWYVVASIACGVLVVLIRDFDRSEP